MIIFIHHKHGSSENNKCNGNINKYTGDKFLQIQIINHSNNKSLELWHINSGEFKCPLTLAIRSYCRAADVFGRIEDVIVQIFVENVRYALLYGLGACHLRSSDSLGFMIDRFFMNIFKTNNLETVT